jgi:uncharacterized protein (DUF2147 family)
MAKPWRSSSRSTPKTFIPFYAAGHLEYASAMWLLMSSSFSAVALATDIDGRWMTFDPGSGEKRSIVEIRSINNESTGRIVDLFAKSGDPSDPTCGLCSGTQQGQKIRGLEILNLRRVAGGVEYSGKILDPEEGQSYKCIVTLDSDAKRLTIRGYVGIPLLGRNVVWERIE